jgi:hypothetical protein
MVFWVSLLPGASKVHALDFSWFRVPEPPQKPRVGDIAVVIESQPDLRPWQGSQLYDTAEVRTIRRCRLASPGRPRLCFGGWNGPC